MDKAPEKSEDLVEVILKAGKRYSFCTCGHSNKLPFCDDSHGQVNAERGTNYCSFKITPESDITIYVSSKNWKQKNL